MKTISRLLLTLFMFIIIVVMALIIGDPYLPGLIFVILYIFVLFITRDK